MSVVVQLTRSIQLDVGIFNATYRGLTSVVGIDAEIIEIINQRQPMGTDQ